jgi:hypothetical protein
MDLLSLFSAADDPDTDAAWAAVRRAPRLCDEALTGTARVWLRRLPTGRRPLRLCERFPRVANRIAWCWHDTALAGQVLEDLLTDRRGGRAGFPKPVVAELRRLREYHDRGRTEPARAGWLERFLRNPFAD